MNFPGQFASGTANIDKSSECLSAVSLLPGGANSVAAELLISACQPGSPEPNGLVASLLAALPDGLFVVEPRGEDFRWLFTNSQFGSLIGQPTAQFVGSLVSENPGLHGMHSRCSEALCAARPIEFDQQLDSPDRTIDLHTRLTPIFNSDGRCIQIAGVCRDSTEQRSTERQLRKKSRRLQNILDSISDGFVLVDSEWRITFANARAGQILGKSQSTLVENGVVLAEILPDLSARTLTNMTTIVEVLSAMPRSIGTSDQEPAAGWISARAYPSKDGAAVYLQDVSERKNAETALKRSLDRIQSSLDGVVNAMAFAVEMRDPYTGGHQRRVSALACAIARKLGYAADRVEILRIGGLLHDVGKISIPSEILNRPGKLSEPERLIIQTHAQIGYDILKEIEFDSPVALIALQHHERLDGSGYPQGLYGANIIPEARITAIADVVEAMSSHRPYRPALGVETALQEVLSHRGSHYDELAVDACVAVFTEYGFDFEQVMQAEFTGRAGDAGLLTDERPE